MKGLVAKEVRMLLPTFLAALVLAVAPMCLLPAEWPREDVMRLVIPLFCFGVLLMALTSFGREFSMGTFPLLLSLPATRGRVWRVKIGVLAIAMLAVFAAGCVSMTMWQDVRIRPIWIEGAPLDQPHAAAIVITTYLVVIASGLWTTLLLRQMVAALWIALLVPVAIMTAILWENGSVSTVEWSLGVYAAAGFWWARRLFYQAEEVAWTGGEVTLPELRPARAGVSATGRNGQPMAALLGKELRLFQVPLAGMAGLFVMHLGAIALRKGVHGLPEYRGSMFSSILQLFAGLWILVPAVTGGVNVADERRMGTMEAQLCLPVSRRRQFVVKFLMSFLITGVLSVLLLWVAEGLGMLFHAPAGFGGERGKLEMDGLRGMSYIILLISLVVFYAATLSRNVLQTIVTAAGVWSVFVIVCEITSKMIGQCDPWFWRSPLREVILFPTMLATSAWLAYRNYGLLSETRRIWLRNGRGLVGALIFATMLTELVGHRTWEYLTPMEPPHGGAKLSLAQEPRVSFSGSLSVPFPDGAAWWRQMIFQYPMTFEPFGENQLVRLGEGKWIGTPGNHFLAGTNWVAESVSMWENAAIRGDGTLWVTEKAVRPFHRRKGEAVEPAAPMVQFGRDTDWKDIARVGEYERVLLKKDGTLWSWGTNHVDHPLSLKDQQPHLFSAGKGWSRMLATPYEVFLWKDNGEAWIVVDTSWRPDIAARQKPLEGPVVLTRWRRFDHQRLRSVSGFSGSEIVVREDGTLWSYGPERRAWKRGEIELFDQAPVRIGVESDWVSVAADNELVVLLRADGTLWQWGNREPYFFMVANGITERPLTRLGIHNDWVALGAGNNGICSLAADGSLWSWSDYLRYPRWLEPSRKPMPAGNIFAEK